MFIEELIVLALTVLAGGVSAVAGTFLGLFLCDRLKGGANVECSDSD